jgi:hypothetical protein
VSPQPKNVKGFQLLDEIAAQALTNTNYRRRLLDDPKSVLREKGLAVPDDVEVVIHRNGPNLIHLVLPSQLAKTARLDVKEVDVATLSRQAPF